MGASFPYSVEYPFCLKLVLVSEDLLKTGEIRRPLEIHADKKDREQETRRGFACARRP